MSVSFFKKFNYFLFFSLLIAGSANVSADDTEIYFSSASSSADVRSNVLLILDTSGSMTSSAGGGGGSRITVMKQALVKIINEMEDVNVGLMRFTNKEGGPVLRKIQYIDDTTGGSTLSYTVGTGNDDAQQELTGNTVSLGDPVLPIAELSYASPISIRVNDRFDDADERNGGVDNETNDYVRLGASSGTRVDGVRFNGVTIPQGATITTATLRLERYDGSNGSTANISAETVDNSIAFNDNNYNVSSRTNTENDGDGSTPFISHTFDTSATQDVDVTTLIQYIVNRAGWSAGNALNLILNSTNGIDSRFYSYDKSTTQAPLLIVDFTTAVPTTEELTGIRFQDIKIPQGATITSAVLKMTASSTVADDGAEWTITAEKDTTDGDSAAFTGAASELSGRSKTTASVDWDAPAMTQDTTYESPDIKSVVEEVVKDSSWCGGNSLSLFIAKKVAGTRYFYSYDGDPAKAPTLDITYNPSTATGCYKDTETAQVSTGNDDAEQASNNSMDRNSSDLDIGGNIVGVRFQGLDIPQGATIQSATIDFRASGTSTSSNPTVTITGQAIDDAPGFSSSNKDISDRTNTTASVSWSSIAPWNTNNEVHSTPELKTIVQEIVSRSGWASGNSMVFKFTKSSGTKNRAAVAFNDNAQRAPTISITYQATGGTATKTVRDDLIELVNSLPSGDWTPIVETFYEAAHYWRGEDVVYGKSRDGASDTRISSSDTYTGGTVYYPSGCTEDNLDAYACRNQAINGNPVYVSPFSSTLTCQTNYQILLTDGEANENEADSDIRSEYLSNASCQTKKSDNSNVTSGEKCGIDLVKYMAENDQSTTLDNDQLVKTYTVGFDTAGLANATQFLKDVASAGGGQFYEANNADSIVSAFETFLGDVKSDPTSFVAPSLATNSFNRLLSRDEAYFGLFTPSKNIRWPGNVKKYNVCIDSSDGCTLGEILDATGASAVGSDNKFKTTSQSIWSDTGADAGTIDGRETTLGGVGGEMVDYTDRIIYTDTTSGGSAPSSGTVLSDAGYELDSTNWDSSDLTYVRNLVCPTPSTTSGSECESYMLWLLGANDIDPESDDTSSTTRWTVNDVLHSSPQVITYGGADNKDANGDPGTDGVIDTFYDKIIFGTNEGGLRMVNGTTGKEEWTFMPSAVLGQQRSLIANGESDHLYGFDVTPTLRVVDTNSDGFIVPSEGDLVHVYAPMRRGGNNIYALDLTATVNSTNDTVVPKFLWRIEGGTNTSQGNYTRLAQTWSEIKLATIKTGGNSIDDGGTNTKVLIFGGGYDSALDSGFGTAATASADNNGNSIYIVNPDTGKLIFWISGSGSGADIQVPDMHYSIPTTITIVDSDGDGDDDRLYFGDTGGQVWRVDLGNDIKTSGSNREGSTIVGRLASISTAGTASAQRRFFEPPSYVQVTDTLYSDAAGGEYDYVLLGTGNRAHPLESGVLDRFYGFRDEHISTMPDTDGNNIADSGYPSGTSPAGTPIGNGDLVNVTNQVLDSSNSTHKAALGWYYDFDTSGSTDEKVLSAARTIAGAVLFTTYEPEGGSADPCTANIGGGNAYNFNILNTKAFLDWDTDGTVEDFQDRKLTLGGGIPSDVVPVFTKEGVVGIVGVEGGAAQLGTLSGVPRVRTYWYQEL